MRPGIHLVHKRAGETSFSHVLAAMSEVESLGLRRAQLPVCHGGALDPFAEGLLILLAGQATRLIELMHPIPKSYVATVAWGAETDNGDPLGEVIARGDRSRLSPAALEAALGPFLGWTDQVPPAHSNKRVGGERAWQKARRGEPVVLPPSRVYLHEARWLSHDLPGHSVLELTCRGGYYVRALARDLGRGLGARAHLSALRRTAIGPWRDPGPGERPWIHGKDLIPWCSSRLLSEADAADLRTGRPIPRGDLLPPEWPLPSGFPDPAAPIRGIHGDDLVALLREKDGQLSTFANLRGGL